MIVRFINRLAGDRAGGTAIEYGLIAALVVIAMIVSFVQLANTTTTLWGDVRTKVVTASAR